MPATGEDAAGTPTPATTFNAARAASFNPQPLSGLVEDDADDTIVPRLPAGANRGRVSIVTAVHEGGRCRALDLAAHLAMIEDKLSTGSRPEARNNG